MFSLAAGGKRVPETEINRHLASKDSFSGLNSVFISALDKVR
jgi:hypothetical protein